MRSSTTATVQDLMARWIDDFVDVDVNSPPGVMRSSTTSIVQDLMARSSDEVGVGGSPTLPVRWSDDFVDVDSPPGVMRSSTTATVQDLMARWIDDFVDVDVNSPPGVMRSSTTSIVQDLMARNPGELEAPPVVTRSSTSDRGREKEKPQMAAQHAAGTCLPCIFFMKVPPCCKFGDECTHCHLCTVDEARKRRNRISYEKRKVNRKLAHQL